MRKYVNYGGYFMGYCCLSHHNGLGLGDIDEDVIKTFYRKNKKKVIGTLVVPLFIIFLVPDKTDFATIYVVPKITNQEFVTKTLPEMYEVIKKEIKELQK